MAYSARKNGLRNALFPVIDHVNGGGNTHRKEVGKTVYRWLRKQGYPEGYRVLCDNCNAALGRYGYCPHQQEKGHSVYFNKP